MDQHNSCNTERLVISPRKILLIGTLGSGKTTLAEYLTRDTGFPYASIDECRIRYADGTMAGEDTAWDRFLELCSMPGSGVLEFSGMGPHAREVRDTLVQSATPILVIWLALPADVCITRARQRKKTVPFPYPLAPVEYAVPAIHAAIEDAWDTIWSTEPCFRTERLEFSGTESPYEIYSVVRTICSLSG
jgi:predicted kinase